MTKIAVQMSKLHLSIPEEGTKQHGSGLLILMRNPLTATLGSSQAH